MRVRLLGILFGLLSVSEVYGLDPACLTWFEKSKISRIGADCEIRCASYGVDLGTIHCPEQCDELCKPHRECTSAEKFWRQKLKNGVPKDWPHKKEKGKTWQKDEAASVISALERIPQALWLQEVEGIFRMDGSVIVGNAASRLEGAIVLYDLAFAKAPGHVERVLVHELAHRYWDTLRPAVQNEYRLMTGWIGLNGAAGPWKGRANGYVEDDGRGFPEEDFANNLEYYLLDNAKLKRTTPGAHTWILQRFGNKFKLGAPCDEG